MEINGASSAQSQPVSWDVATATFTPDEILQYVQTRLADIDGQIKDLWGDANAKKARSDELRMFQETVRSLQMNGGSYDTTGWDGGEAAARNEKSLADLDAAIAKLTDPELQGRLNQLKIYINEKHEDDKIGRIPAEPLQHCLDYAKDQLSAINGDNELTMMRLSALVQLRSQVISAASNQMASTNECTKNVISNMRA
jgi:hypothetical protein